MHLDCVFRTKTQDSDNKNISLYNHGALTLDIGTSDEGAVKVTVQYLTCVKQLYHIHHTVPIATDLAKHK